MPSTPDIFKSKPRRIRSWKAWEGLTQRQEDSDHRPMYNQAEKIIRKLGGPIKTAELVGCAISTVYRWMHGKGRGGNGIIPTRAADKIKRLARREGILLTKEDWVPELTSPRMAEEDE